MQFLAQMRFLHHQKVTHLPKRIKKLDGKAIYVEGGHTRFVMKIPVDAFYALALLQLECYTF